MLEVMVEASGNDVRTCDERTKKVFNNFQSNGGARA